MRVGSWRRLRPPPGIGWLAASGLLLGLAHPPFHLLVPSFVALVPFTVWLLRLPEDAGGRDSALRGGFFLGLLYYSLVFYWLFVALVYYTSLAILAFLAPVLILAGFTALLSLAVHLTRHRLRWPVWIALPVFWTATEWFRSHLGDVAFPWMGFGDTLTGYPWLIGAADLVGSRGLSTWLVAVNALLAVVLVEWRGRWSQGAVRGLPGAPVTLLLAVIILPIGYSGLRWRALELRPAARVVLVQPNVPEDIKLDRELAVDSAMKATDALLGPLAEDSPATDLVVLPETALPDWIDPVESIGYPGRPDLEAWAARWAARLDASLLYGGMGLDDRGNREYEYFNSAFLVDPSGARRARYDKHYLVPVVERVPFVDPGLFRNLEYFGGFGVGRPIPPLDVDGTRFGVLICYESIFPRLSRRYRREGADFLVNITNDAWFGREEPWWSRTSGLTQHPAHLVMRAIENRMGVARAANTGISEFVDPLGRVTEQTPLFEPAVRSAEVLTSDERTLYTRVGDVAGWSAAVVALVAIIGIVLRRPEP